MDGRLFIVTESTGDEWLTSVKSWHRMMLEKEKRTEGQRSSGGKGIVVQFYPHHHDDHSNPDHHPVVLSSNTPTPNSFPFVPNRKKEEAAAAPLSNLFKPFSSRFSFSSSLSSRISLVTTFCSEKRCSFWLLS